MKASLNISNIDRKVARYDQSDTSKEPLPSYFIADVVLDCFRSLSEMMNGRMAQVLTLQGNPKIEGPRESGMRRKSCREAVDRLQEAWM